MNNKKPVIATLSLVAILATGNISSASEGGIDTFSSQSNQDGVAPALVKNIQNINFSNSLDSRGGFFYKDPIAVIEASAALEENELYFNHIFGRLLQFGNGEICFNKLQKEIINKKKSVKNLKIKEDKAAKSLKDTVLNTWENIEKELAKDKRDLDAEKVDIVKLQEKYRAKAIMWFSAKYGVQDKKNGNCPETSSDSDYKNARIGKNENITNKQINN